MTVLDWLPAGVGRKVVRALCEMSLEQLPAFS